METEPAQNATPIELARRRGARSILNPSPSQVIDSEALRAVDLLIGDSQELAWAGEHLGTSNNPASLAIGKAYPGVPSAPGLLHVGCEVVAAG
jgi:hypothetical protein